MNEPIYLAEVFDRSTGYFSMGSYLYEPQDVSASHIVWEPKLGHEHPPCVKILWMVSEAPGCVEYGLGC